MTFGKQLHSLPRPMGKTKRERIQIIFQRLRDAPVPTSIESAESLIAQVVNDVEDEHYPPAVQLNEPNDRMRPPLDEHKHQVMCGQLALTKANVIYFWKDGGFDILDKWGKVVCFKHHNII